jgi:hypothetical protein
MGRRSRQRASAPPRPSAPSARERTPVAPLPTAVRRSRRDVAPRAPWGRFPLVELCALAAIVLGVWGLLRHNGVLLTGAAALGSVAGLEVAIREHLGGYRSHTLVLSGAAAVATLALALLTGLSRTAVLTAAPVVLVAGLVGFRQLFKRRSGGAGMRVR